VAEGIRTVARFEKGHNRLLVEALFRIDVAEEEVPVGKADVEEVKEMTRRVETWPRSLINSSVRPSAK
jgi:hypothetical protein